MASRWRSHRIGTAVEMYWWIRANVSGWTREVSPSVRTAARGLAGGDPSRVAAEHEAQLLVVEAGELGRPHGHEQRVRLAAVGVVGRVDDLLGRDLPVQVEQVDGAPDGRVEEDARDPAQPAGQTRHVGDPGVGDDQLDALVPADERLQVLGDRRQPAAAVDQDRHGALDREREDRPERSSSRANACDRGCELDPACAEVEDARRLLERPLGEVEPHERDETAAGALRVRQVRSFGTQNAGSRSCSSMQNTNAPAKPCRSSIAVSSSYRAVVPSMSWPRCVCASKRWAPSGSSTRSSAS